MKKAFTLAEVLITLGIIGVVAAITLPTIVKNYKEREFISAWKKVYSDVSNATLLMSQNEEDISTEQLTGEAFAKYLKIDRVCEANKGIKQGCWRKNTPIYDRKKIIYTDDITSVGGGSVCMHLTSGAIFCVDCGGDYYCNLTFDVNGPTKPNEIGTDVFSGTFNKKLYQIKPARGKCNGWGSADGTWVKCSADSSCSGTCDADQKGYGCSAEKLLK